MPDYSNLLHTIAEDLRAIRNSHVDLLDLKGILDRFVTWLEEDEEDVLPGSPSSEATDGLYVMPCPCCNVNLRVSLTPIGLAITVYSKSTLSTEPESAVHSNDSSTPLPT